MNRYSVVLRAAKASEQHQLGFVEEPVRKRQARFVNRVVLRPELDLNDYTCRAVIDWIDLHLMLTSPTQRRWIRHHIDKEVAARSFHVRGRKDEDEDEGTYREFVVRIQEPSLKALLKAVAVVRSRWGLQEDPGVSSLEVSLDFTPKHPSREALARMFGVLVRTHLPSRDVVESYMDRPRFVWGDSGEEIGRVLADPRRQPAGDDRFLLDPQSDSPAPFDATYYAGARGSRSAWRTMIKLVDQQNHAAGTRRELPEDEQRVRIEVTLNHEELRDLEVRTLDDLAGFRFQTLRGDYFGFWLPTFPDLSLEPAGARRLIAEDLQNKRRNRFLAAGVVGLQAMDAAWLRQKAMTRKMARNSDRRLPQNRRGTGQSGTLVQDDALARKAAQALRHLGNRMKP